MARPRKSLAEKAITGAGKREARPASTRPKATVSALRPPPWLVERSARAVWNRIVPELLRLNIMTANDADTFARYCTHFAGWIKESKRIAKEGSTVLVKMTNSEERMPRLHPAVKVREIHEKNLLDIEDRFGGSPLARFRLIAQQAAYPGAFGDLFAPREPQPQPQPPGAPSSLPSASPIGALRPASQLN